MMSLETPTGGCEFCHADSVAIVTHPDRGLSSVCLAHAKDYPVREKL